MAGGRCDIHSGTVSSPALGKPKAQREQDRQQKPPRLQQSEGSKRAAEGLGSARSMQREKFSHALCLRM